MNDSCRKIRKRAAVPVRTWLLIFLIALLLHLLLLSLFRPLRENVAESSSNDRYVLFFILYSSNGGRSFIS